MSRTEPKVAFVLGGGGQAGAAEVGMLQALFEYGVVPQLIVGTSVGALNGAAVAAEPSLEGVARLRDMWLGLDQKGVFDGSLISGAVRLIRSRTHFHSDLPLRRLLAKALPATTFEELAVPFQCVAASIERAAEQWFERGPLVEAILASAAVPGVLPPVEIDGEHYVDGGIVNSIPLSRAVKLGATEIFVLHPGRIEQPLEVPTNPAQVAFVAFEIARRHRFAGDLAALPSGVTAHVLPAGRRPSTKRIDLSQLNYRNFRTVPETIERAQRASKSFLKTELG